MTNKRTKLFSHPAIDEAAAGSARMWSARLVMIMLTLPLAYIGAGAGVALTWGGAILSAETLSFIATRPFRTDRTRTDFQRGLYLFSSLYTILAWLLLGVLYWMTGEPALMITAIVVLAGQLIYVQGFMHGSPVTLAIGGIPTTAALIGTPMLVDPFEPRLQLVLVGSLVVMVIISGYENFVCRIDVAESDEKLSWVGKLDAGTLKLKVASSIVAISSVHLLKAFMNVADTPNDKLLWLVIIHLTFVASALLMGVLERLLMSREGER